MKKLSIKYLLKKFISWHNPFKQDVADLLGDVGAVLAGWDVPGAEAPDGVGAGLQTQVPRQRGDGRHEAHYQRQRLNHLARGC